MTRDAHLFYLEYKDFQPIIFEVEALENSDQMKMDLAIFKDVTVQARYLILSVNAQIDNIIIKNGGVESKAYDFFKKRLKIEACSIAKYLFGKRDLIDFLPE
jgi:hypothetical protein